MKKGVNKLTIILISIIIILLAILVYGVYTGFKVRAIINSLQSEINNLNKEKNNLTSQFNSLHNQYNLLEQDVAKIYKTCMRENICKGHFPLVSWYCNNVGDNSEPATASHICVCDDKCDLNITAITHY